MPASRLDQIYRRIVLTKFFTKGWGKPQNIKRLFEFRKMICQRENCYPLVSKDYPIHIDRETVQPDCLLLEGHFFSPFAHYLPGIVPKESEVAYFQVCLPRKWKSHLQPICLHLAGTGDHYFWRRRTLMAKPLLKEYGIGSIILENPFYGLRKPKDQLRSSLHNVSDIFVMGGCLALESIALFHWCEKEGLGPLGVTGISMGGHMASIAAGVWPKPLVLVPCLSWTTASCVFTQGVMSGAIPWHLLENQYFSDGIYRNEFTKMFSPLVDDDAFKAGQHFAKNYPESLERLHHFRDSHEKLQSESNISISSQNRKNRLDIGNKMLNLTSCDMQTMNATQVESSSLNMPSSETFQTEKHFQSEFMRKNSLLSFANFFNGATSSRSQETKGSRGEAFHFMRGIMDEFTHLSNFSRPVDSSLIIIVVAKDDAYVLREGIVDLTELWPGAEVRYIDAGHISAFLFNQNVFRKAIAEAFDRHINKHYEVDAKEKLQENTLN